MSTTVKNLAVLIVELKRVCSMIDEFRTTCWLEYFSWRHNPYARPKQKEICNLLSEVKNTLKELIVKLEQKQRELAESLEEID